MRVLVSDASILIELAKWSLLTPEEGRLLSPSIPQLFSGKRDWRVYIANPKKGWYRLAV